MSSCEDGEAFQWDKVQLGCVSGTKSQECGASYQRIGTLQSCIAPTSFQAKLLGCSAIELSVYLPPPVRVRILRCFE